MKDQEHTNKEAPSVIVKKSGEPYPNRGSATLQLNKKNLAGTHEVIEYSGGYAIAKKALGKQVKTQSPPQSEKSTKQSDTQQKVFVLCPVCKLKTDQAAFGDPCVGEVVKHGQRQACTGFFGSIPKVLDGYKWVKFANRTSDIDPVDVTLGWNGDVLVMQRDKEVCLPEQFIEVAQNALKMKWDQIPGETRKRPAPIQMFPFSIIRDGTKEEYENQKKKTA